MAVALAAHRVVLTKGNCLNHPSDENAAVNTSGKREMSKEVRKAASLLHPHFLVLPPHPPTSSSVQGDLQRLPRDLEIGPDGEASPGQAVGPLCLEINPEG